MTFLVMIVGLCAPGRAQDQGALALNILRVPGPVVSDGYANLWEIVGLDTIKRLTAQVTVP